MDADARQLIALDVTQLAEAPTAPVSTDVPRVSANAGSRSLIRNALLSYVSTGVNMATGLFTTPILLSRLGSDHFGTWALMGSVAAYTGLIEIGLGTALAKRVAEHEAKDDRESVSRVLGTALTMYLAVAVGVLVISSTLALFVDRIFHIPAADVANARLCLLVLGANQAMIFLFTVQNALLYGAGRLDLLTMAGVVINIVTAVLNITAVMMGFGIVALSGIVLFSSLMMGLATRQIIRRRFPGMEISSRNFSFTTAKQLLQFGSRNAVIYLFAALGLGSDAVVIGIFLPVAAVANYAVASKLTALMRTLATKPIDVTMPSVAHANAMGDHNRLFQIQTQATLLSLAVALPMVIAVSVFADRVISFWVGMGHEAASSVLVALSLTTVFLLPGNVSLSLMTGTERNGFLVKVALVTAPLNLLLSILFTHWLMKPVGVALGSMLTVMVADFLVMPFYTCRQFGFSVRRYVAEGFGPLLLPALVAAASAVALRYATPHAGKYWLPPMLVVIAMIFVAALVLSIGSDRRRDYMESLRMALQKRTAGWSGTKANGENHPSPLSRDQQSVAHRPQASGKERSLRHYLESLDLALKKRAAGYWARADHGGNRQWPLPGSEPSTTSRPNGVEQQKSLRVLMVVLWDGGGVITAIRNVATHLRGRGVRFSAFCFNGFDVNSRWGYFCDPLYNNRQLSLTELLVREHFDVVMMLDEAGPAPYSGNLWLERARFKGGVVCTAQNSIHRMEPDQFAHVYLACSQASRDFMSNFVSKPIRVVCNGVDTDQFHIRAVDPADVPARPVLAWVGRSTDHKQKDVYAFLHLAAALLAEPNPEYDFWIADGDPENSLIRLDEWFGDRVKFHRQLKGEQIATFFNQVAASGGAVISTSAFEGLPMAMLEAAACGCPVIVPRAPGFEYIRDGQSGLLYDRHDGLANIRACLARLKDHAFRQSLIDGAIADINAIYNQKTMAEGYYQAFVDAVEAARVGQNGHGVMWDRLQGNFYARALQAKRMVRRLKPSFS